MILFRFNIAKNCFTRLRANPRIPYAAVAEIRTRSLRADSQLPALTSLQCLHMANTQRSPSNLPPLLDTLVNLTEVDLSRNKLAKIPDCLFTVPNLKRLNISDNNIAGELNVAVGGWRGSDRGGGVGRRVSQGG